MLLDIYKCEKPFEILAINRKPRTRMGVYIVEKQRINVYAGWSNTCPLEEIAIHEKYILAKFLLKLFSYAGAFLLNLTVFSKMEYRIGSPNNLLHEEECA